MIGYYRRLIPNFNKTASVLYDLLQEKSDMIWWPKHTTAVQSLKNSLAEVTQVKLFDPDKDIVIKTDASKYAVGAVLEQDGQPIAFESRELGPREQLLPAYEAELLAIVHALMKWKHFIGNRKVTVETEHATLGRMPTQKEVSSKLGYWLDKLVEFNLHVIYKPGRQNVVADAISRRPDFVGAIRDDQVWSIERTWRNAYTSCEQFKTVAKMCQEARLQKQTGEKESIVAEGREYGWQGRYLSVRTRAGWRVCVPGKLLRKEIMLHFHDHILAGHPGVERTRATIRQLFWWPKTDDDIETFVKSCVSCAKGKASHQREGGLLQPLPIPNAPWEEIAMDLIVGLPPTREGWDAIVTIICRLTKMAHFIPCIHTVTAQELASLLVREVIRLHGVPSAIVSDRDTRFTSDLWREMCQILDITQRCLPLTIRRQMGKRNVAIRP